MDANPLRERRLLFTFFVSVQLLRGADIGYLALHFISFHFSLTELSAIDVKDIAYI